MSVGGGVGDDHDQAAILARRRRLIALSLLGLSGPACTSAQGAGPTAPDARVPEESSRADDQPSAPERGIDQPAPKPCLSVEQHHRERLLELERQALEVETGVEGESSEPELEP